MDNFFHTFKTTSSQSYQSPFLDCITHILGFKQKIPNWIELCWLRVEWNRTKMFSKPYSTRQPWASFPLSDCVPMLHAPGHAGLEGVVSTFYSFSVSFSRHFFLSERAAFILLCCLCWLLKPVYHACWQDPWVSVKTLWLCDSGQVM